jgi:hypothetical protein
MRKQSEVLRHTTARACFLHKITTLFVKGKIRRTSAGNIEFTISQLDYVDLEELKECVKHTNVMAHSQGYLLKMKV